MVLTMDDQARTLLEKQILQQGDLVRKLKSAKADKSEDYGNKNLYSTLDDINSELSRVSFIGGWCPSNQDSKLFNKLKSSIINDIDRWVNIKRWLLNIQSYSSSELSKFPVININDNNNSNLIKLVIKICSDDTCIDFDKKVRQ